MWHRYLVGNPLFLHRVWKQKAFGAMTAHGTVRGIDENRAELLRYYGLIGSHTLRPKFNLNLNRLAWSVPVYGTRLTKRILDSVASATALCMLSPLLLCFAAAIRLDSPGPVLFSQMRVGRRGKTFRLWKFRSMYSGAEASQQELGHANEMDGGILFKMKKDPRITRVGRFIRKYSIDEVPQLWNVLIGEMSLVGPRPALPEEVSRYTLEERARLEATPGITCIWQVSGRSNLPFPEQVSLDVKYIYSQSTLQDFKLLLQTIPAVLQARGAY
jgi:lipopolysaccharide/colanic/teichoic acid biosynthesis glycosyltransferase